MKSDIIIVDEDDAIIGYKRRDLITYNDIYRVSGLWLTDAKTGDVLIAQRKWTKKNDPGKWSAAAAGTNDKGETYEQNILKEAREELGLTDLQLRLGPKQFVDDSEHQFFCQLFVASIDKEQTTITMQAEELEAVRWIPVATLIQDVQHHPDRYVPSIGNSLDILGLSPAKD